MNKIVLLGRLVRDPEVRYTQTGKVVCQFTLAVDRPFTQDGKREADFINCIAWNKTAETIGNYVHKGQRILAEGRLQIRSYDANDGSKHWITEVIVNNFEFIERKEEVPTSATDPGGFESMAAAGGTLPFDEEIPF